MKPALHLPNMLLIGATGRNSGKTTLASQLVEAWQAPQPLAAVKFTVVHERTGRCPRGGEGCGVCTSIDKDYLITHETNPNPDKDTGRLLAAGAQPVYWVRVLVEHMRAGLEALLELMGPDRPMVAESNSLRHVVQPGLFLMVHGTHLDGVKRSAELVRSKADAFIYFDGQGFDLDPAMITFANGAWHLTST